MNYSLSSAESQLDILVIAVPGPTDHGQYGSGRGIPCGCPVATGLRAGHFEKRRHPACSRAPYNGWARNSKTTYVS